MSDTQTCRTCGRELPLSRANYQPDKSYKSGWRSDCKRCRSKTRTKRSQAGAPGKHKKCAACQASLPADLEHFYYEARGKHGLSARCKACARARDRRRGKKRRGRYAAPSAAEMEALVAEGLEPLVEPVEDPERVEGEHACPLCGSRWWRAEDARGCCVVAQNRG